MVPTSSNHRGTESSIRDIARYVITMAFRKSIQKENGLTSEFEPCSAELDVDALIVGAGFGGVYMLHKLRDTLGLRTKVFEAGRDIGGIWHWNCYPGARVDSDMPVYQYSIEKVWHDWTWTERFPGWEELRRYFDHVDKVLDIRKDVIFNTNVTEAYFDQGPGKWTIKTEEGKTAKATYLILAIGFAAKRHFPDWSGLEKFKGVIHHSSFWPEANVDIKGKRVGVVGTGATGVQLSQECAKLVGENGSLTVFQRTPNLALPMQQRKMSKEEQDDVKCNYPQYFRDRLKTFAGFLFDWHQVKTFDATPEERELLYQKLWDLGGFNFWVANYKDLLYVKEPNHEAYKFWAKKTRARIDDPRKRDILAPLEPPHAFGTKRPSLEQDYYEQFNKPNVDLVDIKANPVKEVVEGGIVLEDGTIQELDVIALATGFDSVTGGLKNIKLAGVDGIELADKWKAGTWTHLGLSCSGFPNMFFLYAAQGSSSCLSALPFCPVSIHACVSSTFPTHLSMADI